MPLEIRVFKYLSELIENEYQLGYKLSDKLDFYFLCPSQDRKLKLVQKMVGREKLDVGFSCGSPDKITLFCKMRASVFSLPQTLIL
jgi:hypothetical protein